MRRHSVTRNAVVFLLLATFLFSIVLMPADASGSAYSLQYNTVMDANGDWVTQGGAYYDKWSKYNCYAFAIGRAEDPNFYPFSNYLPYTPGDISGKGTFLLHNQTIGQLAGIVVEDLKSMGYSNVETSSTIPTINSSQELICVRRSTYAENEPYDNDYHFMRYDLETNAWYHKPGGTAVLKYNGIPTNDVNWLREGTNNEGEGTDGLIYDSDIVFITYSKNQINIVDDLETSINIGSWVTINGVRSEVDVYYELNFEDSLRYEINLESDYAFEYNIYSNSYVTNKDFTTLRTGSGTSVSTLLDITEGNKYYLRINFTTDVADIIDVSIEHKHVLTYGRPFYILYHTASCSCGYTCQDRHVVRVTDAERAPCVLCGLTVRVEDAIVGLLGADDLPQVA